MQQAILAANDKAAVVLPPLEIIPAKRAAGRPPKNQAIPNIHHLNDGEMKSLAASAQSRAHSNMALFVYANMDAWKREIAEFKGKRDQEPRIKMLLGLIKDYVTEPAKQAASTATGGTKVNILINGLSESKIPARVEVIEHSIKHIAKLQASPTPIEEAPPVLEEPDSCNSSSTT